MISAERGAAIIGREVLRLEAALQRDGDTMGKARRKETEHRQEALRWALNVLLTGDTTKPPGAPVAAFLGALRASGGGTRGR